MKIKPKKFSRSLKVPQDMPTYPSFSISLKDFPDAKDWKVGQTYKIEMTVKQSGMSQYKGSDGSAQFEILEIEGEAMEDNNEDEEEEESSKNYSRITKK